MVTTPATITAAPTSVTRSHFGAGAPAVTFDNVSFAFDEHIILREISFTVPKVSMTIVLGPSGAGKSIVLKLILGLLRPDSGTIFVNGERINTMRERDLIRVRADIGMLFQESALFDSLTVAEMRLESEVSSCHLPIRRRQAFGKRQQWATASRMPSATPRTSRARRV